MARVKLKFPKPYKRVFSLLLMTSWLSGVVFFVLNNWVTVEGDFGRQKHPWQFTFLKIHGGAAFLAMISYGFIMGSHVPLAWKTKRMRKMGIVIVSALSFLVFTAYLLYYVAGDEFRILVSYAHAAVGFSLPFLVGIHLYLAKHSTVKKKEAVASDVRTEEVTL